MSLNERDKKHIWHPLTQHHTHPDTIGITKAKNCTLWDENGNSFIDAISSWYTCVYGHCNDFILDKVKSQMERLDQIVFSGFTHQPAVELSEKLIEILPKNQIKFSLATMGLPLLRLLLK